MRTLQNNSTAAASRMEHQILEHVKQALRVTLDWKAPSLSMPQKLSSVSFTLQSFQRHLERLMAIEEKEGYMREVADANPNLHRRIECLADDHHVFRRRIETIVPLVEELKDWEEDRFADICADIRALLVDVDQHDLAEIKLLQDSFLCDDGGEG